MSSEPRCNLKVHDDADMVEVQRGRILELERRICRQRVELARANKRIEHLYRESTGVWDCFTGTKPARDATAGLSTATLTALAEAGGVKRVLELLGQITAQPCRERHGEQHYYAVSEELKQETAALLGKLGGVE